ncbi:RNA-directed DNA polymerase, eukaryota, reverse transcriptase zinc-binding domain protein [Tanacetum coccineum]
MYNEDFISCFKKSHAVFLPYIISDHCPALVIIPDALRKNKKSFRFANYIADKPDFLDTVGKDWKSNMEGFQMFKNGNPNWTEIPLMQKLKKRKQQTLLEYKEAKIDENNLLKQKVKIDWLKEGDKNTAYFHKVMKGRKHLSRIECICNEDGKRFYGDDVPDQFVKHFHLFLGVERPVKTVVGIRRLIINKLSPEEASNMIHLELLKGYKRKNRPKRCALKIDLQKAYDTIQGYFKGARGLRQGDPISPYLFTLVMKILNLIMIRNIEDKGNFKYHVGCKELKITHLCFADDLMVFCHGDVHSISIVKQSLDEFRSLSGFLPNLKKSTAFFGSIRDKDKIDLLKIIPFSTGVLPMKYLGVPLLARYIGVNDFYLIPKTVVKEINKVMKKFLWDNKSNNSGRAKVAWKVVCRPKDQDGLGIKPLGEWNETLLLKNIWKVMVQSQTLWVKWVNRVKLKGRSIWDIDTDNNDSWGWRKLMEMREKIRPHVFYNIGNGKATSVWYDKWSLSGPLSNFINRRDIYDARLKDNSCVADMIKNGSWIWPNDCKTNDSVPHLFFECAYSMEIWDSIKGKIMMHNAPCIWEEIIKKLNMMHSKNNIKSIISKIGVAACGLAALWEVKRSKFIWMYHKEGLVIVKGIDLGRVVCDGWNRECVKDEPSWSIQHTTTGG